MFLTIIKRIVVKLIPLVKKLQNQSYKYKSIDINIYTL